MGGERRRSNLSGEPFEIDPYNTNFRAFRPDSCEEGVRFTPSSRNGKVVIGSKHGSPGLARSYSQIFSPSSRKTSRYLVSVTIQMVLSPLFLQLPSTAELSGGFTPL